MKRYTGYHERVGTYISGLLTEEIPETGEVVCIGPAAKRLKEYEDLGLTPEQLMEIDKLYAEKCREVEELKRKSTKAGWIPCSERLPEEPEKTDDVEESIYSGRLSEYNVMIKGAEKATTLYYAGDGYWYDEVSQEYYPVTKWQPLPEP